MAIVFGGDTGLRSDSWGNMVDAVLGEFSRITDGLTSNFSRLTGKPAGLPRNFPKENIHVDDGFQNVPGTVFTGSGNIGDVDDIKTRKITTQSPMFTVYVKKKLFWSLRNEHDTKFMDSAEKLFLRASKLLFERKCAQVASYEAMTKLERLIDEEAEFDVQNVEQAIDAINEQITRAVELLEEDFQTAVEAAPEIANELNDVLSKELENLAEADKVAQQWIEELNKIKEGARLSKQAVNTSWVVDTRNNTDNVKIGRGVGVIELTLVDSVRTGLSLDPGNLGNISFTLQDPYNLMSITNVDVELALSSAVSAKAKESDPNQFPAEDISTKGAQQILEEARRADEELRKERRSRLFRGSDVADIVFEINPSSAAPNKVAGRTSLLSEPFNKDNFRIIFLQLPLEQQLTTTENELMVNIFKLLDDYVSAINAISTANQAKNEDEDTTYTRRQLRKYYLGKSIIQPMDGVHVYIRSNTFRDAEPIGPLSVLLNSSPFVRSFAGGFEPDGLNDSVLQEEMKQFNIAHIPVSLYRKLRTSSLLRNAGTHVFGGLVSTVSSSYNASRGEYTLQVSGESNMKWLKLSRVNVAPSLDQPRGVLEDPLTPLKLDIDPATGLILGNPVLSDDNRKRNLYYKDGVLFGERLNDQNLYQDMVHVNNKAYAAMQHAPGLAYRWKEGVISATQQQSLRTSLRGGTPAVKQLRRDVGVTITKDGPFANLDVADVISLLVTGFPHNYESFYLNAISVGSFADGGEQNSPESYFHSFFDITRSTNRALGNFVPFKNIDVTPEQMARRLNMQTDLVKENKKISELQSKIAKDQDTLNQLILRTDPVSLSSQNALGTIITKNRELLNTQIKEFSKNIESGKEEGLRVYGSNIIVENPGTSESDSSGSSESGKKAKLRTKLMQMRPQISTKLNTDNNLFVVSDEYDKDLDIQAFITELQTGEIPIWNSQYKTPIETCINAASVIDFEFFCDTQGNIQFRPPQYNRIPISLLAKMLLLSESKSIELLPPFVKALFTSRREGLEKTVEVLDMEIRILNLFLFGTEQGKGKITNAAGTEEIFSTTESGIVGLISQASISNLTSAGDIASKIQEIKNQLAQEKDPSVSVSDDSERLREIQKEVEELNNPSTPNVNTRRLSKLNKLMQLSSQQQRAEETIAKMAGSSVKEQKYNKIVKNAAKGFGSPLAPGDLHTVLEPFGNLLEDDFNDFLGPGSSRRFIIYDSQIINYDFKESDSNVHCRVDVTGQQDLLGEQPGQVGGVPILWAGATDFDLWKQYGWRQLSSVNKPYFKNAEQQCAPYALMLLSIQRRDAVRATLTIVGNEYYQLGDVVYINSKDLLYYVYGVSHSISFSGTFTTTLDLRYGHAMGEFIPTPLDVIGKHLIKNQRKFNTTFMYRSTAGTDKGRVVGVALYPSGDNPSGFAGENRQKDLLELGDFNLTALKNALLIINTHKDSRQFKEVDIRGFVRSIGTATDPERVSRITERMKAVADWLTEPIEGFSDEGEGIPLNQEDFPGLESDKIKDYNSLTPILVPIVDENTTEEEQKLPEESIGRTPSEDSYNLMLDPKDPQGEFNTIEIVITFEE
jgi:hypothetical protein